MSRTRGVSRLLGPQRLKVTYQRIADLEPYARNARLHSAEQVEAIAESMREYGWTNPVLVDVKGGIIAGHGRVLAGKLLELERIPTIVLEGLSEKQKRALILADNKLAEDATWDKNLLRVELKDLGSTAVTGFTRDEVDRLLAGQNEGRDPDAAPAPPARATSKAGDVWVLGAHRVLCGDSTEPAQLRALMGEGGQADAIVTDPPYNVAVKGKAGTIANDDMETKAFGEFLRKAYEAMASVARPGAPAYVFHGETEREAFTREFVAAGFYLSSNLIWRKNALVLGRSDYHFQHEPILYGWREGGPHPWHGERDKTTVLERAEPPFQKTGPNEWQITLGERVLVLTGKDITITDKGGTVLLEDKPVRNDVHPTMKPVDLLARLIRNSSKLGAVVLDPFGGSGSTLIACEQTGRQARLCELDPRFADVIVLRWQDFTGQTAVHAKTGKPFRAAVTRRAA